MQLLNCVAAVTKISTLQPWSAKRILLYLQLYLLYLHLGCMLSPFIHSFSTTTRQCIPWTGYQSIAGLNCTYIHYGLEPISLDWGETVPKRNLEAQANSTHIHGRGRK